MACLGTAVGRAVVLVFLGSLVGGLPNSEDDSQPSPSLVLESSNHTDTNGTKDDEQLHPDSRPEETVADDHNISEESIPIKDTMEKGYNPYCSRWSCKSQCVPDLSSDEQCCQCDELCAFIGDCCVDYFSECQSISDTNEVAAAIRRILATPRVSSFNVSSGMGQPSSVLGGDVVDPVYLLRNYGQCIFSHWDSFWAVSSCPADFGDISIKNQCENASNVSPVSHFHHSILAFRNAFCAQCHHFGWDVTAWPTVLTCDGLLDDNPSVEDVLLVFKEGRCRRTQKPPETESLAPKMPVHTSPRRCQSSVSEINQQIQLSMMNGSYFNSSCTADDILFCLTYKMTTGRNNTDIADVKNPYCWKCQTGYPFNDTCFCDRDHAISGPEFGISKLFFSLGPGGSGVEIDGQLVPWPGFYCGLDEVYDHDKGVCRKLTCFRGYELKGRKCVPAGPVVHGHTQLLNNGTDFMLIQVWLAETISCQRDVQKQAAMSLFHMHPAHFEVTVFCSENDHQINALINSTQDFNFTDLYNACVNLHKSIDMETMDFIMNITLSNIRSELASFPDTCPDGGPSVTICDANTTEKENKLYVVWVNDGYQQLYPLENIPFNVVFNYHEPNSDHNENKKSYDEEEEKMKDSGEHPPDTAEKKGCPEDKYDGHKNNNKKETVPKLVIKTIICEQNVSSLSLNCTANAYPKNQTSIENGTLSIQGTDLVFEEDEYEVHDDIVLVCSRYKNWNSFWDSLNLFNFSPVQKYMMIALTVISVLSLLFVLSIYSMFPELRTLPGKIIMCLVVCLLAGHLTLIIDVQNQTVCRVLGILSHFVWLACFAWMSAMAVHMASTFVSMSANIKTQQEAQRMFWIYSLVCWSLPFVLVTLCFTLDVIPSVGVSVDYGKVCGWIGNGKAVIWAFFVPVGVSLVVNFLAFLAAVVGIERTARLSSMASSRRSEGKRLLVYVKMSAALGFTWILGLISAFVSSAWLQWIYVILNSLQGTMIALAYVLNERVAHMASKRWSGESKSDLSSTAFGRQTQKTFAKMTSVSEKQLQ